jgi:hypothetical protein
MAQAILDLSLVMRDSALGAVTTTGSTTGLPCAASYLTTCGWHLWVLALDASSSDETYVFTLETSTALATGYGAIATWTWPRGHGIGHVNIPIGGYQAFWSGVGYGFIRTTCTVGGTSPSIVYGSGLGKPSTRPCLCSRPGYILTAA